ncbi:MAG: peptidylprolyl isomerase [Candidatus Woesearchaeota archaeon]
MRIKEGSRVKVHYTGTLDDGSVFDSSEGGEPLEFTIGDGQIIKGFEEGLLGKEAGDEANFKILPDEAYGREIPEFVQKVSKEFIPPGMDVKTGSLVVLRAPDGRHIHARVKEISEGEVTLDFNHPLAGKTLAFRVKIIEVR